MISKKQYSSAKKTVLEYENKFHLEAEKNLPLLRKDLWDYFKNTYIKSFYTSGISIYGGLFSDVSAHVTLFPLEPEFDEDYGDDKMDADLLEIGKKYNIVVKCTSDIYGK